LNIIFTCFLVRPVGEKYYGAVAQPAASAASMEVMWKQGVAALTMAFSYDVVQIINLFQDPVDRPRQFSSVKDLDSNYQQLLSVAGN
jgi:hypothetical protein